MQENFYFTYWMARYSKGEFTELVTKMCQNIKIPVEIGKGKIRDEYIFQYFYALYCISALDSFGLNEKQISLCLDLLMTVGCSKLYPPAKMLERHRNLIPEIIEYVNKDLEIYSRKNEEG